MAECSPSGCSSSSYSATSSCEDASSHLQQEAEAFSDDSGVDVKPQAALRDENEDCKKTHQQQSQLQHRNKRKSSEPRRRKDVLLMKRFRWEEDTDEEEDNSEDVFDDVQRPASGDSGCRLEEEEEEEAAPLVKDTPTDRKSSSRRRQWRKPPTEGNRQEERTSSPALRQSVIRKNEAIAPTCTDVSQALSEEEPRPLGGSRDVPESTRDRPGAGSSSRPPRNYKGMSRQRRIEANARERTRVHTISAAFESLRRAVPAYAHNQKLSKLAILRIASAYIVALACLSSTEGSNGTQERRPSVPECVERCTRTIQAEGRSRRRTANNRD